MFSKLIVLCVTFAGVVVNATIQAKENIPTTKHLRSALQQVTDGQIPLSGYFERVHYSQSNCTKADEKLMTKVNHCFSTTATTWRKVTGIAYQSTHLYSFTIVDYSDSSCTNATSSTTQTFPILECSSNYLYHERQHILIESFMDLSIATYETQDSCNTGGANRNLMEIDYYKFNKCYQADGGDVQYLSCDNSNGLSYQKFTSTNGSCSGPNQYLQTTPAQYCASPIDVYGFPTQWYGYSRVNCGDSSYELCLSGAYCGSYQSVVTQRGTYANPQACASQCGQDKTYNFFNYVPSSQQCECVSSCDQSFTNPGANGYALNGQKCAVV